MAWAFYLFFSIYTKKDPLSYIYIYTYIHFGLLMQSAPPLCSVLQIPPISFTSLIELCPSCDLATLSPLDFSLFSLVPCPCRRLLSESITASSSASSRHHPTASSLSLSLCSVFSCLFVTEIDEVYLI